MRTKLTIPDVRAFFIRFLHFCISTFIIEKGGVVYGAAFDNAFNLLHSRIDSVKELHKIQGTKYVQSSIGYSYKQIKNDLKKTGHFIRCFALIPACFYILSQLKKEKPDVVHLFWGHYPSLVGFLVRRVLKNSKISNP